MAAAAHSCKLAGIHESHAPGLKRMILHERTQSHTNMRSCLVVIVCPKLHWIPEDRAHHIDRNAKSLIPFIYNDRSAWSLIPLLQTLIEKEVNRSMNTEMYTCIYIYIHMHVCLRLLYSRAIHWESPVFGHFTGVFHKQRDHKAWSGLPWS